MLLIEPPFRYEEWVCLNINDPFFPSLFATYCEQYVTAVMSLSHDQRARIVSCLGGGQQDAPVTADSFHSTVYHELAEEEFEASSKVARLIMLCALADSLAADGLQVYRETEQMLDRCWDLLPSMLLLAIDDHYGLLTGTCG